MLFILPDPEGSVGLTKWQSLYPDPKESFEPCIYSPDPERALGLK